jgi:hypothetical protein
MLRREAFQCRLFSLKLFVIQRVCMHNVGMIMVQSVQSVLAEETEELRGNLS